MTDGITKERDRGKLRRTLSYYAPFMRATSKGDPCMHFERGEKFDHVQLVMGMPCRCFRFLTDRPQAEGSLVVAVGEFMDLEHRQRARVAFKVLRVDERGERDV